MIAHGFRSGLIFAGTMAILAAAAVAMIVVRVLRPGKGRRICQEVVGGWAGETILKLVGVELVVHREEPWPAPPCFYMSNHSSSLDLPILMALRLPDTRSFIKERFRWFGPLGLVTMLTGTFFTAPHEDHERRVALFKKAEEVLRRSGGSVFGSPEGTRVPAREIGPFNRGVFHIVTNLGIPIVPMLILIPAQSDPGRGYAVNRGGVVHVHVGDPISTVDWTFEGIEENKENVRDRFVAWNQELLS